MHSRVIDTNFEKTLFSSVSVVIVFSINKLLIKFYRSVLKLFKSNFFMSLY